jgi:Molecular chaperone (small heat shock protein)
MFDLVPFRRNSLVPRDLFANFFDRVFDDNLAPANFFGGSFKVDVKETDKAYLITADLPGVEKDAISLTYDNNFLTIAANREETVNEEKENYLRQERRCGSVTRQFYVENVERDKISAEFKNGVLKIALPKLAGKAPDQTTIDIQ